MSQWQDVSVSKADRMATIKDPTKHKKEAEAFAEHKKSKVVSLKTRD